MSTGTWKSKMQLPAWLDWTALLSAYVRFSCSCMIDSFSTLPVLSTALIKKGGGEGEEEYMSFIPKYYLG